jgi:hypothetical protein
MSGDTRIVYGANCCWWDSIDKCSTKPASATGPGLPCCPHCGSVLFEQPDEATWFAGVDAYAEQLGDTQYRAFIEWLRGKCFRRVADARAAFDAEQASRREDDVDEGGSRA